MPVTAPQVQLNPRHLSSTTLSAPLLAGATQMQVASGTIFDTLPTAALLTDNVNVEIVSVDSLASGTTYNITRAIEPGTSSPGSFPASTTQVKLIIAAESFRRLQRGFRERTTGQINVLEYGAVGDGQVTTGSMSASVNTTRLVADAALFVAGDVGKRIVVYGAGAGGTPLVTTIAAFVSTTTVTLSAACVTTATSQRVLWGTDDAAAINAAIGSIVAVRGGRVTLPPANYLIASTIIVPSHVELLGTPAGQFPRPGADYAMGTMLSWAGATNTPMVKLFDVQGVHISGLQLNGGSIAGVWGYYVDSDAYVGHPATSSQLNVIENFGAWNCAVGVQHGNTANPALGGTGGQCDTTIYRHFWISCTGLLQSTARGFVFNADNSQICLLDQGIITAVNKGVYCRVSGGVSKLRGVIFGAITQGTAPADVELTPSFGKLLMENCQGESGTCFYRASALVDDTGSPTANLEPTVMLQCHLDEDIIVDGGRTLITIGCGASGPHTYSCLNASSNIISIGDLLASTWTMTAGKLWQFASFPTGSGVPVTDFPYLSIAGGTTVRKHLSATASILTGSWTAIAQDGTDSTHSIFLPGARPGDTCIVTPDSPMGTGLVWSAQCIVNDAVSIRMTNVAASQTPGTAVWRATVLGY